VKQYSRCLAEHHEGEGDQGKQARDLLEQVSDLYWIKRGRSLRGLLAYVFAFINADMRTWLARNCISLKTDSANQR
jgi:hypothetical protein